MRCATCEAFDLSRNCSGCLLDTLAKSQSARLGLLGTHYGWAILKSKVEEKHKNGEDVEGWIVRRAIPFEKIHLLEDENIALKGRVLLLESEVTSLHESFKVIKTSFAGSAGTLAALGGTLAALGGTLSAAFGGNQASLVAATGGTQTSAQTATATDALGAASGGTQTAGAGAGAGAGDVAEDVAEDVSEDVADALVTLSSGDPLGADALGAASGGTQTAVGAASGGTQTAVGAASGGIQAADVLAVAPGGIQAADVLAVAPGGSQAAAAASGGTQELDRGPHTMKDLRDLVSGLETHQKRFSKIATITFGRRRTAKNLGDYWKTVRKAALAPPESHIRRSNTVKYLEEDPQLKARVMDLIEERDY